MKRWTTSLLLLALVAACGGGESKPFFEPRVVLQLSLPAELPPTAVECLDIVLSAPDGEPPPTSLGFGSNPLFIKVQTLDLNGDGRRETRIRFVQGSKPFPATELDVRFTGVSSTSTGGTGATLDATFGVSATARRADGLIDFNDRCLGGTALAAGEAQTDSEGRPIRFRTTGNTLVPISMACLLQTGCAIDGGTSGGSTTDGGVADGG